MMKEGSPVTQEFSIERKKMINDSFMFRVHIEEFSSLSKLALHDKSKCRNCKLCNITKDICLDCKLGMKMEKNTALDSRLNEINVNKNINLMKYIHFNLDLHSFV